MITNRSGVKDKHGNCVLGQPLPTLLRKLCGCTVAEYDAIGPSTQQITTSQGSTYRVTSWCGLLTPETAEVWARYTGRFYAGTPAITRNRFGKGWAYYVGTVGEKALYRALLLEIFPRQGIPAMDMLPAGVEVTERTGPGGSYRFIFNNTLHGQSFPMNGQTVTLGAMEVLIQTGDGQWR